MARDLDAILFDFDGTIADTYDLILSSFRHAVADVLGRELPDETLMSKVGQPLAVQMWDFAEDEGTHEALCRSYRAHNAIVHDEMIAPFPLVHDTLTALASQGIACAVVTSKRHDAAMRGISRLGLEGAFSLVVGSDDFPLHKPDPGPIAFAASSLGFDPRRCAYVGDSPFDMQAGTAAGCYTVAVSWGMFSEEALLRESPNELVRAFPELLAIKPLLP